MKTKIEWCDFTWNPVWGCKNNCEYCYARKINQRFKKIKNWNEPEWIEKVEKFPQEPSRIFVNSMSDIAFWQPEWMEIVLNRITFYPQHTFMFLTKCPEIYQKYEFPENCWLGVTAYQESIATDHSESIYLYNKISYIKNNKFISIEPMQKKVGKRYLHYFNWIILGAETGNRKNRIIPQKEWIEELIDINIPLFMKDNLRPYWNGKFRQEFPL